MPRKLFDGFLRRSRRKRTTEGSECGQNSAAPPTLITRPCTSVSSLTTRAPNLLDPGIPASDPNQLPITPLGATPPPSIQTIELETLPNPTAGNELVGGASQIARAQPGREPRNEPKLPKPYASSVDLWKEALGYLNESEKHDIEDILDELASDRPNSLDAKSLAVAVQDKIDVAFKTQRHNGETGRIVDSAVAILSKFLAAVDVASKVLTSRSELRSQLLAGIAMVALLLAQCNTYQQLYIAQDPVLRPSEAPMSKLKISIVQAYAESQLFLSFAIQQERSKVRAVAAPFRLGDAEDHISGLSKCEKELSRAADNCDRDRHLSNRSTVQELLKLKSDFSAIFQQRIALVMNRIDSEDRIRMLEWISNIPYGKHHNRVKEARSADTSGAGKTFLASKVIDHRQALLESSPNPEGFAFFYCDRNEEQRRKPLSILQSYVRQLSTTVKNPECIRKQLEDLCRSARANASDLGFDNCRQQLLESVNLYTQTTLVLDALDEDRFLNKLNIEIEATDNDEDIKIFVGEEIAQHGNWNDMRPGLKDKIVNTLQTKSRGMFQWASLQIDEILSCETELAILDRLEKLPPGLTAAYDEIYARIKNKHDRTLVDNAFKWVACAYKPLTSEELLTAIRFDSQALTIDLSEKISESQLLHICKNLLVLDSQRRVWRFSHLSVTEYFEERHWGLKRAHCHCATACLKLLLETHGNFTLNGIPYSMPSLRCNFQERRSDRIFEENHPFQTYAGDHWRSHIRDQDGQDVDSILAQPLKTFLGSPRKSSLQYQAWYDRNHSRWNLHYPGRYQPAEKTDRDIPLLSICLFSFYNILLDWWEREEFDVSVTNNQGYDLLRVAVIGGSKEICENLIKRGIELNFQREVNGNSALSAAVSNGQTEIVQLLIRAGAHVNLPLTGGLYGSALEAAACQGYVEILSFLIQAGAEVNAQVQAGRHGCALIGAIAWGEKDSVEFLVFDAGADVNQQIRHGKYGCALAAAAYFGRKKCADILVKAGANVNLRIENGSFETALQACEVDIPEGEDRPGSRWRRSHWEEDRAEVTR
ncbi:hypothetical protein EKO27_g1765 [Xylaria grammica]|uniref:Uncharacterized protein n=1 Tax=Xylaria grammica TaxID=363999 RepID=A0A439DG07_9PEZI|nr:hypothetical protein EKO27_g1765 [Xylaria grammica]